MHFEICFHACLFYNSIVLLLILLCLIVVTTVMLFRLLFYCPAFSYSVLLSSLFYQLMLFLDRHCNYYIGSINSDFRLDLDVLECSSSVF